ncbi:Imm7 family immunity protein [Paenibacillus sp. N3.4]|uniref:Imm7 family immunity protein n=1 Tax=Paenibacillus sp. N3.4 TaxID=2603222 RepID=UPI0011C8F1C5|nr:Imm7 family immunity protein [Paenibacillus sp. N3.4]TXK84669.1 hypothetical protein FU659_07520 [Paenibacillus sp. N3.4]
MYEYHGWATIQEASYFIEEEEHIDEIIEEIKEYIHELNWRQGDLQIRAVNGEFHLLVSGFSNHNYEEPYLLNLYRFIASKAPGSYGLLYIRDGTDVNGKNNIFRVIVLARGNISEQSDPFLSPCVPVIEDEVR